MHARQGVSEGHSLNLNLFVIVEVLLAGLKLSREIDEDAFLTVTRRHKELADHSKLAGPKTHLLFKLSRRGFLRCVAALDSTRGDFERVAPERITPLPY